MHSGVRESIIKLASRGFSSERGATVSPPSATRQEARRLELIAVVAIVGQAFFAAARLCLELSERARSTLEAELADEWRRREETERERDELRQELETFREKSHEEEAPESPESPGPGDTPPDAGGEAQEATERQEERRGVV
jgi:hypothetical protein